MDASTDRVDSDIAQKTIEIISAAKERWLTVASIIPEGEYHRHAFALGPAIRGLTTNVVFSRFILTDELAPAFQVSDIIGRTFSSGSCQSELTISRTARDEEDYVDIRGLPLGCDRDGQ
jgi:hypothetical protein